MSLWLGQSDEGGVTELIATLVGKSEIQSILDEYVEPEIGSIRLSVNAASTLDLSRIQMQQDINSITIASMFLNGWAYANGAWISKTFFPKAFEILKAAGLQTTADNTKVRLPNLAGFLYGAGTASSNSGGIFKQDPQAYGLPRHNHDFKFDTSKIERSLIRNATWIYSTKSAGQGEDDVGEQTYTSGGKTYVIPAGTPTAHAGGRKSKVKRLMVWDLPVNVSTTTSGRIDAITGDSITTSSNTEICPKHIIVNALIFIGRPQNI